MERSIQATHVAQVNSVKEFQDRTKRAEPDYKSPVHKSAREVLPSAPKTPSMGDVFGKKEVAPR